MLPDAESRRFIEHGRASAGRWPIGRRGCGIADLLSALYAVMLSFTHDGSAGRDSQVARRLTISGSLSRCN
jgi:hypothetical protein